MPAHAPDTPISSQFQASLSAGNVACPQPLTPPPDTDGDCPVDGAIAQVTPSQQVGRTRHGVNDNTAVGMTLSQEESMYTNGQDLTGEKRTHVDAPEQHMKVDEPLEDGTFDETADLDDKMNLDLYSKPSTLETTTTTVDGSQFNNDSALSAGSDQAQNGESSLPSPPADTVPETRKRGFCGTGEQVGVPSIDQQLDWSSETKAWDFSHKRRQPQYPSATLQPYSVFKGTQQSDRQIYNVEVTILTVDVEQASMSGYLQICGLTPDHPTLTTFFTGDIIGGPNQKHSFRTSDPAWGASDKTDLTHWARFPAWRPLSLQAKRNINFVYPLNHENWWQQEHIFMRWKEHFLVPDYKLKSIQGASFEGFYYICFNQVEGRVSGIYFHSKSEKYQQLELKHEGKQGVWGQGVCPSIEFR